MVVGSVSSVLVVLAMFHARGLLVFPWLPIPSSQPITSTTTTTRMLLMDIDESRMSEMIVILYVGTPPQRIRCLLDSGSSDLWIPSRRCPSCEDSNAFSADRSTTFWPEFHETPRGSMPRAIQITYTSGAIAGYAAQETVTFDSVTVENQSFIIVEAEQMAQDIIFDGILGLGWSGLAHWGTPLYQRLRERGVEPVFTLVPSGVPTGFPSSVQSRTDSVPRLVLGQVPELPGVVSHAWVSAENATSKDGESFKKYWLVSGSVGVDQEFSPATFLVDTGTNLALLVPKEAYTKLVGQLLPQDRFSQTCAYFTKGITCSCSMLAKATLPPVSISLGGHSFTLDKHTLFHRFRTENCQLQIQPQFGSDHYWVLGAAFLQTCVLVFDFDRARMGFAKCGR
jgi:hypothetical protein